MDTTMQTMTVPQVMHQIPQPQPGMAQPIQPTPTNAPAMAFEEHVRKEREKERRRQEHQRRVEEEQLVKRKKKLERQKEHESRMQQAQQAKLRKKEERLQKVQEEKRKHAERDARAVNVQMDMENLTEEVQRRFSQYGEIEQVKWDQFTCSFNILFGDIVSAQKSLKDGKTVLNCPATMQSRLVRGWCVHFPDPEHATPGTEMKPESLNMRDAENVPAGATSVSAEYQEKVNKLFSRFGQVSRIVRMRGFLVVELDSCDAVFNVETTIREAPDSLTIDGELLEPVLTGVPKRSVEKVLARF